MIASKRALKFLGVFLRTDHLSQSRTLQSSRALQSSPLSSRKLALMASVVTGLGIAVYGVSPSSGGLDIFGSPAHAQAQNVVSGAAQPQGFADMVERVKPSVISVKVIMRERASDAANKSDDDRSGYGTAEPPALRHYCHALDVSMSGYYHYRKRLHRPAPRVEANRTLLEEIVSIYRAHEGRYGYLRITAELRKRGVQVGRHRIARLMHEKGLRARHKKLIRITTRSDQRHTPSPNRLAQRFHITRTNRVWLSDITYIATEEGYLFLTVVLDLASRQIVGWSFSDRLEQDGVLDAMERAFTRQRPGPAAAAGERQHLLSHGEPGRCADLFLERARRGQL